MVLKLQKGINVTDIKYFLWVCSNLLKSFFKVEVFFLAFFITLVTEKKTVDLE